MKNILTSFLDVANSIFVVNTSKYISDRKNNDSTISLIKNINDIDAFYETLELYTVNIKDILLDIPNANIKLIQLIEKLNYDKFKNNKYITIFNNISLDDSDLDTESNSSSDSDSD